MPRCYMVKKGPSPLEGTPPCSPTEASVAPPCYTPQHHPTVAEPRPAQSAEPPRHVGTQYEEPRSGDYAEKSGGVNTDLCGGVYSDQRDEEFPPRIEVFTHKHRGITFKHRGWVKTRIRAATTNFQSRDTTEAQAVVYIDSRGRVKTGSHGGVKTRLRTHNAATTDLCAGGYIDSRGGVTTDSRGGVTTDSRERSDTTVNSSDETITNVRLGVYSDSHGGLKIDSWIRGDATFESRVCGNATTDKRSGVNPDAQAGVDTDSRSGMNIDPWTRSDAPIDSRSVDNTDSRPGLYTDSCGGATASERNKVYNESRDGLNSRGSSTESRSEANMEPQHNGMYTDSRREETTNSRNEYNEPHNGIYTVLRAAEFTDPQLSQFAAQVRQTDYTEPLQTDYNDPRLVDYTVSRHTDRAASRRSDYSEEERDDYSDLRLTDYSDPRHPQYSEPRSGDYAEPRTVRYLERDLSSYSEPRVAEYAETRELEYPEQRTAGYDESRSADYAEPRPVEFEASPAENEPCSAEYESQLTEYESHQAKIEPRVAEGASHPADYESHLTKNESQPADYEPRPSENESPLNDYDLPAAGAATPEPECEESGVGSLEAPGGTEYAELQNMSGGVRQHSAADTEAAHELLSLAAGVPPLPPATVLTVVRAPEPVLPLYTYAIQPTNIYIIAEDATDPTVYAAAVQALTPIQQVEFATQPQVSTYIAYPEAITPQPTLEYQQLYAASEPQPQPSGAIVASVEATPLSVPVSVIEAGPAAAPLPMDATSLPMDMIPLSVQVPVIEPVPLAHQLLPTAATPLSDSEPDEPAGPRSRRCTNEKNNKYVCNVCGKRYATSSNLSRHKQTHRSLDSQAAKRCDHCGKVYVSMPALAMHVLTHRMGHVCGVCGKQFSRPWLLRGHLRSHTGEKPYDCPSCNKSFADRSNLRAHLQTHSGDKKWECVRCNKTFALKSYLNKHQEAACSQDEQETQ